MLAELCALILLAAPGLCAEEEELRFTDEKIVVHLDSPWPNTLKKGWLPLYVRIENNDERAQRVVLSAESSGITREINATVEVGPNQTSSIELIVPVFLGVSNSVRVLARVGATARYSSHALGAPNAAGNNTASVLVLNSQLLAAGTAEAWSADVSDAVAEQAVPEEYRIRYGRSIGYSTPSGTTLNNVIIEAARFDQMPARSEAYSSLDVVVLDTTNGLPESRQLTPLIAWARLGGSLLVVGSNAEQTARSVPELAHWMEPRFDVTAHCKGWQLSLGTLSVDDQPALQSESQRGLLRSSAHDIRGMVEDASGSRMHNSRPVIPDLFALPLKGFSLFLILFAILIGPVNFVLVKRTKKPAILLITIPAIAFGAALLLFLFGILSQGLDIKVASTSLSVLDQREHRASSSEVRMIFAGLSPGAGLVPRSGSSCYALGTYRPNGRQTGEFEPILSNSRAFRVDQTEGLMLSGQFIPARTAFLQQILAEHAERARIAIKRDGTAISIENGLGTRIRSLVLRDAEGNYHHLSSELAAGASARLEPVNEVTAFQSALDLRSQLFLNGTAGSLPPASYLAELERNPFGDDCGVTGEEVRGEHGMFGVLALDSEEWR